MKTPNNGDTILLTVKTLDGENVGTLDLNSKDGKLNQMKLFTDGKSESILKENNAKAGYWEDVQRCIKTTGKLCLNGLNGLAKAHVADVCLLVHMHVAVVLDV